MGTPANINSGVGFRNVQVLALDANGIIAASGTTAYAGVQISGAKALTINDPEARQIVHNGDDSVFALDTMPPTEPMSGELRVGKQNDAVDTILTGVNAATVGEATLFPLGTNQRGNEAQVTLLAYRQAVDTDPASSTYGKRVWQLRLFPRCYVIPRESGFEEGVEDRAYAIHPQFVNKYPWGISLTVAAENAVRAQGFRGQAEYKPKIVAFVTNNTTTTFTLPADFPAANVSKIKTFQVSTLGVGAVSTANTITTQAVSFTTAPTTGSMVVFYETN